MYNVLIVEDDAMARKLLEIFISTSDSYHLLPSLDSAAIAGQRCHGRALLYDKPG